MFDGTVTIVTMFTAGPAFAQMQAERVYITGVGGFATTPDTTSRDVMGEVGVVKSCQLSAVSSDTLLSRAVCC